MYGNGGSVLGPAVPSRLGDSVAADDPARDEPLFVWRVTSGWADHVACVRSGFLGGTGLGGLGGLDLALRHARKPSAERHFQGSAAIPGRLLRWLSTIFLRVFWPPQVMAPKDLPLTGGTGIYRSIGGDGTLVEFGNGKGKGKLTLHVLSLVSRGGGA
jgi:hypothetical protein